MTELEKKTLKVQTDLVQSVVEAFEKKNSERVDMLITNAIKQLKMSRYKPDQTTCVSLTYIARTSPKIFTSSSTIREVLKGLIKRDQGPTNMKGKSDVILPVLAANILLACCDSTDIRTIILHKIEQWISGNQKMSELVQHLLATLCMKCQSDQATITSLIELRQHWLQYLDENFDTFGPVPADLSSSIKKLLRSEPCCESLVNYLNFLIKHDTDLAGLSSDVSRFILDRPVTLDGMLQDEKFGPELGSLLTKVFTRLMSQADSFSQTEMVKVESKEDVKHKLDCAYFRTTSSRVPVCIPKVVVKAIFTLLSHPELHKQPNIEQDMKDLRSSLIIQVGKISHVAFMYEDVGLTIAYNLPDDVRQKLVHSEDETLVELAVRGAEIDTLLSLVQQFGLSANTINNILSGLESVPNAQTIRNKVKDWPFFLQLISFYGTMGCDKADILRNKLQQPLSVS